MTGTGGELAAIQAVLEKTQRHKSGRQQASSLYGKEGSRLLDKEQYSESLQVRDID